VVWGEGRRRAPSDPSLPSLWRTERHASEQTRRPNREVHGAHKNQTPRPLVQQMQKHAAAVQRHLIGCIVIGRNSAVPTWSVRHLVTRPVTA
jgi:hypothetical protein